MIKAIGFKFMFVVYVSHVTQYFKWFVHTNELKGQPFALKQYLFGDWSHYGWSLKVWKRGKKGLTKRMAGVGGAISVSPAVLFLWSLTELGLFLLSLSTPHPPLTLFTFNPMLEVPYALPVTFFSEELNLASFSVNKKTHWFSDVNRNKKRDYNVALWNVMPTNERRV